MKCPICKKKMMVPSWKICNVCDRPKTRYKKNAMEKSISKLEQLKREALKADYTYMDEWILGKNLSKKADREYIIEHADIVVYDENTFDILGFRLSKKEVGEV
jgi:hypothetical protein